MSAKELSIFDIITDNIAIRVEDSLPSLLNAKLNTNEQDKFNRKFISYLNETVIQIKDANERIQREHGMHEKESELVKRINEVADDSEDKEVWHLPNDFIISAHALVKKDKSEYMNKLGELAIAYEHLCGDLENKLNKKRLRMNDLLETTKIINEKLDRQLTK